MITSVRMVNFKNFADETLKVGPFTIIVGANASGKSNIRDAFRFLHGIGRGYTLAEILGAKYGPGGNREWEGIRGAPNEIARLDQVDSEGWAEFSIETQLEIDEAKCSYSFASGFNPNAPEPFLLIEERLDDLKASRRFTQVGRPDRRVSNWQTWVVSRTAETQRLDASELSRGQTRIDSDLFKRRGFERKKDSLTS